MTQVTRNEKLHDILKNNFGHQTFRLEQLNIINSVLDGKDCLAIMPTGGGKSFCYQIPAIYLDGITIVVSPLISLMHDQVMNLAQLGIEGVFLNSSQDYQQKKSARDKITQGKAKLVYLSPEAILSQEMLEFLAAQQISLIAIDEAHCVSQWGHEFRKDYTRLGELKLIFGHVPLLALTATADSNTRLDICQQLKLNNPNQFVCSFDRPNIKYLIHERTDELKQIHEFIKNTHPHDTGIVYCLARKKVDKVAKELSQLGFKAIPYHAGLSKEQREKNQQLFNTEDQIIVVATIAFGMGIDRPDVRFVAHLDLPKSIEGYYQETGRAGRDGRPASAWMIYGLEDVVKLSRMLENTDASEHYKKQARSKLDSMLSLCETAQCRRQHLLSYFGQDSGSHCENCDTCMVPVITWDATQDAQKLLSTIYKTSQIYGANHLIDILRGSKNSKVMEKNHHLLSVYGIGKDKSKNHWNLIIRQLLNKNYLAITNWEYRSFGLTAKSREILAGSIQLNLRKQAELKEPANKFKSSSKALSTSRPELFEQLRALRRQLADKQQVPPFVIFNDKSLQEMCLFMPQNKDQFLMINGVGNSKLEKYGELFMREIQMHL